MFHRVYTLIQLDGNARISMAFSCKLKKLTLGGGETR